MVNIRPDSGEKTSSLIFVSPNFKIRLPVGFLLTFLMHITGLAGLSVAKESLVFENSKVAKYWTSSYNTRALIEMQKVVDWARTYVPTFDLPLLTFYVTNDPTINHQSAVDYHKRWPSLRKKLLSVPNPSGVPKHIFVGDISGPEKNEWFVNMCLEFLDSIVDQQDVEGTENSK